MSQATDNGSENKIRQRYSLSRNLTITLSLLMALVLASLLGTEYAYRSVQVRRDSAQRLERYADSLAVILSQPMWTFDQQALARIGQGFAQHPSVNMVRIEDDAGRILYELRKQVLPEDDRVVAQRPLLHEGQTLGRLDIELSLAPMRALLHDTLRVMGLTFLAVLAAFSLATGLLLRAFIRRPLSRLAEAMDRVARGAYSEPFRPSRYRELDGINQAYDSMVRELTNRQSALESEIAERKAAEERYALVLQGANDGIWDWDLVTGKIYFSPRWKDILGFAEDEFPNDTEEWKLRIHPEDRQRVVDAHHSFMAGLTDTLDVGYRLRHRDGSWRTVHSQGASLRDASGDPVRIAGAITDITDRCVAQNALRESEEHYRAIVESFDGYIYICDKDFRLTFANDRLREAAGEEPLGRTCHKLIQGLDKPCPWCVADQVFQGRTLRREFKNPKDGRWYYVVNTPIRHPDGSISKQSMIQDITERKAAENALKENETRYRSLIETTSEGFVLLDRDLVIQDTNQALAEMLGLRVDDLMGRPLLDFLEEEGRDVILAQTRRQETAPHRMYEFNFRRSTGESISVLASATTRYDAAGANVGSFAFFTDITDRKRMEHQLRYQAMHDPLTGLSNRTLCLDRISRALERARRRDDYYYAVFFLDLDRFKVINDSMGHSFGDRLLIETSHRLLECVRDLDTVSRFGGDEFIILLEELGSPRKAIQVVKRMRQALRRPFTIENHEVQLTASIGIVLGPTDFKKSEDILQYANIAMHRAKATGRDRFKVFTAKLLEHAINLMTLENHMERALAEGEFFLNYQPIIRLKEGRRLYGFEVLVRWRHPTRGIIPPTEFIPVAEDTGMILDLGLWVLTQSARTMVRWMEAHPQAADLVLSVNVSGRQFSQHDLAARIRRILEQTGLPPRQLKLEITETTIMENAAFAVDTLRQLKELGVTLSIDDFGTGYSSMSYLQRLPLDNLKIDLSFVQMLDVAPENIEIVKAIISLAHTLKLEVVAEGVERLIHQRILAGLDCDYCQGFLYARPLDETDAERFVANIERWELPN